MWNKLKYILIILQSTLTQRSVVKFGNSAYVVAGNVVKRIG
jgi:hypothetical protein